MEQRRLEQRQQAQSGEVPGAAGARARAWLVALVGGVAAVLSGSGVGCSCGIDDPDPPGLAPALVFGALPDSARAGLDDVDEATPGLQIDVPVRLVNRPAGLAGSPLSVSLEAEPGDETATAVFSDDDEAVLRVTLTTAAQPGVVNRLTARAAVGDRDIQTSRQIVGLVDTEAGEPLRCLFVSPQENDVLTTDVDAETPGLQSTVQVRCEGGAPDDSAIQDLRRGGRIALVTRPVAGTDDDTFTIEAELNNGSVTRAVTFAQAGAHFIDATLIDPAGLLPEPVRARITVTVDATVDLCSGRGATPTVALALLGDHSPADGVFNLAEDLEPADATTVTIEATFTPTFAAGRAVSATLSVLAPPAATGEPGEMLSALDIPGLVTGRAETVRFTVPAGEVDGYTVRVVATDSVCGAGAPAEQDFAVDTIPPALVIGAPAADAVFGRGDDLEPATAALDVAVLLRTDLPDGATGTITTGSATATCTVLDGVCRATIALADGPQSLTARVADDAGNVSVESIAVTALQDTDNPTVTVLAPAAGTAIRDSSDLDPMTSGVQVLLEVEVLSCPDGQLTVTDEEDRLLGSSPIATTDGAGSASLVVTARGSANPASWTVSCTGDNGLSGQTTLALDVEVSDDGGAP